MAVSTGVDVDVGESIDVGVGIAVDVSDGAATTGVGVGITIGTVTTRSSSMLHNAQFPITLSGPAQKTFESDSVVSTVAAISLPGTKVPLVPGGLAKRNSSVGYLKDGLFGQHTMPV